MRLRDARPADLAWVRQLNNDSQPAVGSLTPQEVDWFAREADYFRIAEVEGRPMALLIGLLPGHQYDSPNYGWFQDQRTRFAYVDRVIVEPEGQGRGLGRLLYDDFARFAADRGMDRVTCEVNIRPRNDGSLAFHDRLGFRSAGTQITGNGAKEVVLLEREL